MIIKCKMCGGDISVNADITIGKCQYCGSTMTIPKIDSDKKARLFNWANQLRLNNEFDKAYEAYKEIASEDTEEAEAYWGMILSEYGVEYIEDPKTKKRVPTCHRTLNQSIRKSANYEMACQYADIENRFMYQTEADVIDKIQKKIKAISSKQEQYDVFICYKETDDDSGERTVDSVLAQEIYDELSKKGITAFFSRITLKDKLGEDYEPYIYSALKSAKIMLLVTTSVKHCESVWVKNEWSRFITFMFDDAEKKIIPAYKEITAYELPDELNMYQAQDLGKVGAIQDLVLGIESLLKNKHSTKKIMSEQDIISIVRDNELKERQARNALIKLKSKQIAKIITPIIASICLLICLIKGIQYSKKVYFEPNKIYKIGVSYMNDKKYKDAADKFLTIKDFKDAGKLGEESLYLYSEQLIKEEKYDIAITVLNQISNSANNSSVVADLNQRIDDLKHQSKCKEKYKSAIEDFDNGRYSKAMIAMKELEKEGFSDSSEQIIFMQNELMSKSKEYVKEKNYDDALDILEYLVRLNYSVASDYYNEILILKWEPKYNEANSLLEKELYTRALNEFKLMPEDFLDVKEKIQFCKTSIDAEWAPYQGRWCGHGDWFGDDMCFVIGKQRVMLAIGRDGDPWLGTTSVFDEEKGKLFVTYDDGTYVLSVSGNILYVKYYSGESSKMVGSYRKIK